jgi:hypothetical protein
MTTKVTQDDYDDFWRPIVEVRGKLSRRRVRNELADYKYMLDAVPRVYMAVTGGKVSKPMTDPSVVIGMFEEYVEKACETAAKEALEHARSTATRLRKPRK